VPSDSARQYKDARIYSCFVLNRLVSALGIDLYQDGLEDKLDDVLARSEAVVTKADIRHEIRSNHNMTEKVLGALVEEGLVRILHDPAENRYRILITKEGVLHARRFNEFYAQLYEEQIRDHYKYRELPPWFRKEK
jgi:predicted transcriptional regulator